MNKQNMTHPNNAILFKDKKNHEATKRKNLKSILLSERRQSEKSMYCRNSNLYDILENTKL